MKGTYIQEGARLALAREIAQEAIVLLKNQGPLLPLAPGRTVALLGRTQNDTVIGGGGSGASFSQGTLQIRDQMEKAGLVLEPTMDAFYQARAAQEAGNKPDMAEMGLEGLVASGMIYELFGRYNPAKPEELPGEAAWQAAAQAADTAVCVIGRQTGGEECDRHVEDDYEPTVSEKELLRLSCQYFAHVAVVLNVNGMVDMAWLEALPQVEAVLFMGPCGEQGAGALADILTGRVSPSGKLSQTAALCYGDYPTSRHISYNKDDPAGLLTYESYGLSPQENGSKGFAASPVTVYQEDIYVGYRYFDTFEKPVLYPFGFGLGYADFAIKPEQVALENGTFTARVRVENLSARYPGKEAVQLYVHAPFGRLKKPWQELRAIAKTPLLQPGGAETVELRFDLRDLASFDEAEMCYVLEPGDYTVLIGNSAQNTSPAAVLRLEERAVTRRVTADIGLAKPNQGKLALLEPERERPVSQAGVPVLPVTGVDIPVSQWPVYQERAFTCPGQASTLEDVCAGRVSLEAFVAQMSLRELAVLCNGYGPGLPFGGIGRKDIPVTIQGEDGQDIGTRTHPVAKPGYCNPAVEKYGIFSAWYKDGPASVGKVAWPTGMMLACTFNPALAYAFGSACGCEAEQEKVNSWLAPGLNLIRNPIEGRAFEYFSEDPYLCGLFGTKVAQGAIENNRVTVCPKHFALNEQETYRRGNAKKNIDAVDTIVSARAARELYLRPFEMVITQARPLTVMTAFNKVNGLFAAGNHALCTEILRGEWGYDGVVVTDWGDMDFVVDGAYAIQAGNDVIMPGGPPVIEQVLKGYDEGRVDLLHLRRAVAHLLRFLLGTVEYR